jgi:hypothetical protein
MSLPLLVIIVVVGIAATVIAVHMTGGSRKAALENVNDARRAFAADFPDEATSAVVLTEDGQSAFLPLAGGRIGIVQSFGDGFFTRIVAPKDVAEIKLREPAIVSIRFKDFTWTGGHFSFADAGAAKDIASRLTVGVA